MKKVYLYNGQLIPEDVVMQGAKQNGLDFDAYIQKSGMKAVDNSYMYQGKEIPSDAILEAANQQKIGFDDYIQKAGFEKKNQSGNDLSVGQNGQLQQSAPTISQFQSKESNNQQPELNPENNFGMPSINQLAKGQQNTGDNTSASQSQKIDTENIGFQKAHEKKLKEQNKKFADAAIDNTVQKSLKLKGINAQPNSLLYNIEKSTYQRQLDDGNAAIGADKNGKPALLKSESPLESFHSHMMDAINENKDSREYHSMDDADKIKYLNNLTKDNNPYGGTTTSGFGSVMATLGGATPTIGLYGAGALAGGALETLAPETGGLSNLALKPVMSFVTNAGSEANKAELQGNIERYFAAKQKNPNISDEEALAEAKKGTDVDRLAGIGTAALFSTVGDADLGQSVTGKIIKKVMSVPKEVGEAGVTSALGRFGKAAIGSGLGLGEKTALVEGAKDIGHNAEGVTNKNTSDVLNDMGKAFKENAPMGVVLHGLMGVITGVTKVPQLLKSSLKYDVVTKMTPEQVNAELAKNVQSGAITPEDAQKAESDLSDYNEALKTVPSNLSPEAKASAAGLILKRNNILKESEGLDKTAQEATKQQTDAIDNQLKELYRTGNPLAVEINSTGDTFEKPTYDDVQKQRVQNVADKISKGKKIEDAEDLQAEHQFPDELKSELEKIKKSETPKEDETQSDAFKNVNKYLEKNKANEVQQPTEVEGNTNTKTTEITLPTTESKTEEPIPSQVEGKIVLTDKTKDVLDDVTDEKIGEKKYQDFSVNYKDGARAFGRVEDGVGFISGIDAAKEDNKPVRGSKTYERVLKSLFDSGIKTVKIGLQSSDSRIAIDKLINKGVLENGRDESGGSTDRHFTKFDINKEKLNSSLYTPIDKKNTGTEIEPNLGEGRKPVTLSGNTEQERQSAIEQRKKETKQSAFTDARDKILERISKFNKLDRRQKRANYEEANKIKLAVDSFNKIHDQEHSIRANRLGDLELRNNPTEKRPSGNLIKHTLKGEEKGIVENGKPLMDRNDETKKVFQDLLDSDVLPVARRVGGEIMPESEHEATIQDVMDGIPSVRAENYLNSLEKQIKENNFDYGNPDKSHQITLNDALGITVEHSEPMTIESVDKWLKNESELTPEDQATYDNIDNLITHYEQQHESENGIGAKVSEPSAKSETSNSGEAEQNTAKKTETNVNEQTKKVGGEQIQSQNKNNEDAIPIKSPNEMDVQPKATNGEGVGSGNTKSEKATGEGGQPPINEKETKTSGEEENVTGVKKAITEPLRTELGLPKVEIPKMSEDADALQKAKERVDSGESSPRDLVNRILTNKEGYKNEDEVMDMQYYAHQIQSQADNLAQQIAEAETPEAKIDLSGKLQQLSDESDRQTEAALIAGNQWGRIGNRMQIVIDGGFNPSREKLFIKDAYGGEIPKEVNEKLAAITKERDEAIAAKKDIEEKLKQRLAKQGVEKIKKQAEKTAKRDETKEKLKEEEKQLLEEIKKSIKKDFGTLNAGIPFPKETVETLGKLAVNYFKQGALTVEALVDKMYNALKDDIKGLDKKQIRDLIAEYEPLTIERETARLNKKANALDDKINPPTVKTEKGELAGVSEPTDFTAKKSSRQKLEFRKNTEWVKAQQRVANAEFKIKVLKRQAFEAKKNWYQRGLMWANRVFRLSVLSGVNVLYKLSAAASIGGAGMRIPSETIGGMWAGIFKNIAEKAPIEGGLNAKAEVKFMKDFFNPKKFADNAWQILKSGQSNLSKRLGGGSQYEHIPIMYLPTDLHQIIKDPVKRAVFEASMEKSLTWAERNGLDINDNLVYQSLENAAYKRANYEIFQESNALSRKFQALKAELDKKGNVGATGKFLVDFMIPVSTVPTNIVRRVISTSPLGLGRGFLLAREAYAKGIEKLSPEDADRVMRQLKQGSLGMALYLTGWLAASNFGGLYSKFNPNKKRQEGELASDQMEVNGQMIPKPIQHALPFEIMQMAATARHVYDNYVKKGSSTPEAIYNAGLSSIGALLEQVPIVETGVHAVEATNNPYEAKKLKEDVSRRFEPQILRETGVIPKEEPKPKLFKGGRGGGSGATGGRKSTRTTRGSSTR